MHSTNLPATATGPHQPAQAPEQRVEGPGPPLRQEWADPQRCEHILFATRIDEAAGREDRPVFQPNLKAGSSPRRLGRRIAGYRVSVG